MPSLAPLPASPPSAATVATSISFMMGRDNKRRRRRHQRHAIKKGSAQPRREKEKNQENFLFFFICVFKLEKVLCECLSRNDCDYHAKKGTITHIHRSRYVRVQLRGKISRAQAYIVQFHFFPSCFTLAGDKTTMQIKRLKREARGAMMLTCRSLYVYG